MRISDWSSDVCSSDLLRIDLDHREAVRGIVVDEHAGRHPKRLGARAGQGAGLEFRQQFLAIGQRILDRAGQALDLPGLREGPAERVLDEEIVRSEEHTSELQSLMRISYAVFCLKKKK